VEIFNLFKLEGLCITIRCLCYQPMYPYCPILLMVFCLFLFAFYSYCSAEGYTASKADRQGLDILHKPKDDIPEIECSLACHSHFCTLTNLTCITTQLSCRLSAVLLGAQFLRARWLANYDLYVKL